MRIFIRKYDEGNDYFMATYYVNATQTDEIAVQLSDVMRAQFKRAQNEAQDAIPI